ncbi:MAG: transposase [Saprospiraceae bacterium]|nr:transposase [Saprospiraceae bacterium]
MIYRALDYLEKLDFNFIEEEIFEVWKNLCPIDTNTYVLDVTDTYYNGKHDNTSLRKGKDGRVSKLIQIGLAVSFNNGFPVLHKTYKGNISNIKILEDLLITIAVRGLKSMVLDRGFYSEANIVAMQNLKMELIVGMKQSIGVKNNILSHIDRDVIYTKRIWLH